MNKTPEKALLKDSVLNLSYEEELSLTPDEQYAVTYNPEYISKYANPEYIDTSKLVLEDFVKPVTIARGVISYNYNKQDIYESSPDNLIASLLTSIPVYDVDYGSKYYVALPDVNAFDKNLDDFDFQLVYNNNNGELITGYHYENGIAYIPKEAIDSPQNIQEFISPTPVAMQINYFFKEGVKPATDGVFQYSKSVPVSIMTSDAVEPENRQIKITNLFDNEFVIDHAVPVGTNIADISVMMNGMLMPVPQDSYTVDTDGSIIIYDPAGVIGSVNIVVGNTSTSQQYDNKAYAAGGDDATQETMKTYQHNGKDLKIVAGADDLYVGWRGKYTAADSTAWPGTSGGDNYDSNLRGVEESAQYLYGERNLAGRWSFQTYAFGEGSSETYSVNEEVENPYRDSSDQRTLYEWMKAYSNSYRETNHTIAASGQGGLANGLGNGQVNNFAWTFPSSDEGIAGTANLISDETDPHYGKRNKRVYLDFEGISEEKYYMLAHCAHVQDAAATGYSSSTDVYVTCLGKTESYVILCFATMQGAFGGTQTGLAIYKFALGSASVKLNKTSSEDWTSNNPNYKINDTEYTVYNATSNGTRLGIITNNMENPLVVESDDDNQVYAKETAVGAGFLWDNDADGNRKWHTIKTTKEVNTFSVADEPTRASFTASKGTENGTVEGDVELSDVEYSFTYQTKSSDNQKDTIVLKTDASGKFKSKVSETNSDRGFEWKNEKLVVPIGVVTVKETVSGNGLIKGTQTYTINVAQPTTGKEVVASSSQNVVTNGSIELSDEVIRGGVKVVKADSILHNSKPEGDGKLNATYTIYNNSKHPVIFGGRSVPGSTSNSATNAITTITAKEVEGKWIAETTQNALPYGRYTIVETTPSEGYVKDNFSKKFSIGYDAGFGNGAFTTSNEKFVEFTNSNVSAITGWNENHPIVGGVQVIKADGNEHQSNPEGDGNLGATYTIYNNSKYAIKVGEKEIPGSETNDDNNKVAVITAQKQEDGKWLATTSNDLLPYGHYTIVETQPPTGYKSSNFTKKFSIGYENTEINVDAFTLENKQYATFTNSNVSEKTGWNENYPITGGLKIQKADDAYPITNDPSAQGDSNLAAKYTVTNNSTYHVYNNIGGEWHWTEPGEACGTITADPSTGIAQTGTDSLPYGHYTVVEIEPPTGYLLSDPQWTKKFSIGHSVDGFTDDVTTKDEQYCEFLTKNDTAPDNWNVNTVKRGDIELIKHDDQFKRSEAQGDADLENIQFAVINRSEHSVQAPEDPSKRIEPGKEVCRIITKKVDGIYKASTAAANVNPKTDGSGTWSTPEGWSGALAYGSYQVVELSPDGKYVGTGYLFGAWDGNTQKIWHGNAAGDKWQNGWLALSNDAIMGNTFAYTASNGQKFDPDGNSHKWIDDDKVTVTFDDQTSGPNNTVQRGDIELLKADDNWNESRLQGDADLAGTVFEIHNASKGVVVSPQTGEEVQPGGLVCTITSFKDTDGKYKATTYAPAGSLAATANGWSIPASYAILDNGTCGHALSYGQYVVTEKTPPNGYLLNSEWVGRAINTENLHTDISFSVSNGNTFTLAGKTSNAKPQPPTWINEQGVLVKFDNKAENEAKASQEHYHNNDAVPQPGASLDTVEREDESWCEDTIFRAGVRIGKVDRQNGDYKPQGGATLETAIITISSLCNNPIWTLKGTYANGQTPTWGEVAAWNGDTSKKDGVDFLNIVVNKVTKTDGTVQYYASTRNDKGVTGVDFDDGALDITLPYGRYMMREISVDSPDQIYDALTNVNSGYLYDTISQNWRRQFSIGYETNTKHPALTYYSETGSFSTLVQGDTVATPTAIRVTPTDTVKYTPSDPVKDAAGTNHGKILDMTATNDAVPNLVARFDIEFIKKDVNDKLLAGAAFLITSKTTGESHIAITDESGKFSTYPENQLSWHTKKSSLGTVNGNDEGILTLKSPAEITYMNLKTADDDTVSVDMSEGIARIETADGKSIVDSTHAQTTNGVWFYGRTDKKTYDPATATGNGSGGETGNVNEDTKTYMTSIKPDEIQMYRNDMGAFPYDDYIIQELPTGNTVDYNMVRFEVHMSQATKASPSDGLKNRTEMELKSPDPIFRTAYPQDFTPNSINAGTVTDEDRPELHTTLVNEADVPVAAATENYTLIDKVQWFNLSNGHNYKLHGELWKKDANNNIIGDKPIATKDQTFTARGTDGIEKMEFANLDLTQLGGYALVCFEYLYDADDDLNVLCEHSDATDDGQTVTIPEIGTTLTDSDGDKEVSAYKEIKLTDHVAYKGLKPDKIYTFTGTLHFQERDADGNIIDGGIVTDASGNPITTTKDELIKTREGVVDIEFTFMAPDLQGKKVVAFEEVKEGDYIYAMHADITDIPQTVYFPEIGTTALDGITGDHIGFADEEVTLEDIVEYKNLVKGKTYTINGTLMDQGTGSSIQVAGGENLTGSYTFVAGEDESAIFEKFNDEITLVSGKIKVPFKMNGADIKGKAIVVFERLYSEPETPELNGDHEVEISKTDVATSKELPGATLVVTDSSGKIITQWVSSNEPKKIKLNEGIYTLTEYTAPKGYTVAESIEFKVDANGLVNGDKVNMKNTSKDIPEGDKEVEISKTDAATSKELPGATLIVQDSSRTTIEQWVSSNEPKKIKLSEGTYRLIEITAPNGYEIAETIEFKVNENGLVDGEKVEMKDAPANTPTEPIAVHEDINDSNQQVNYPDIRTMANVDGGKSGITAAGEVHLTDVVNYTNLIPGREYVMRGLLMDKVANQPALTPEGQQITSETVFTPETVSGTVEMEFVFNARALQFHDVVVFENAYTAKSDSGEQMIYVAKHEDINDLDQTVNFGEDDIEDTSTHTPIQSTGDERPFIPILITIGIAFSAGGVFGLRRKLMK